MKRINVKKTLAMLVAITLCTAFAALFMALPREGQSGLFGLLLGYVAWDLLTKSQTLRKG